MTANDGPANLAGVLITVISVKRRAFALIKTQILAVCCAFPVLAQTTPPEAPARPPGELPATPTNAAPKSGAEPATVGAALPPTNRPAEGASPVADTPRHQDLSPLNTDAGARGSNETRTQPPAATTSNSSLTFTLLNIALTIGVMMMALFCALVIWMVKGRLASLEREIHEAKRELAKANDSLATMVRHIEKRLLADSQLVAAPQVGATSLTLLAASVPSQNDFKAHRPRPASGA